MADKELHVLKKLSGHRVAIYDVLSHDNFAYTTSADKFVVRWNLVTGEQDNFTVKLENVAFNIAIDNKGDKLLIGNRKGGIHVVNIESKAEEKYLTQHKSPIFFTNIQPK
jgi:WD40 repeat protein